MSNFEISDYVIFPLLRPGYPDEGAILFEDLFQYWVYEVGLQNLDFYFELHSSQ